MKNERIITILVWAAWSDFCSGMFVYLGANTIPYRDRWLLAGGIGAAIGAVVAMLSTAVAGNRTAVLLTGIPFGVLQAVAMELYWPGMK